MASITKGFTTTPIQVYEPLGSARLKRGLGSLPLRVLTATALALWASARYGVSPPLFSKLSEALPVWEPSSQLLAVYWDSFRSHPNQQKLKPWKVVSVVRPDHIHSMGLLAQILVQGQCSHLRVVSWALDMFSDHPPDARSCGVPWQSNVDGRKWVTWRSP